MNDQNNTVTSDMNPAQRSLNATKDFIRANLPACCAELLEWNDTAVLCQGKVRQARDMLVGIDPGEQLGLIQALIKHEALRLASGHGWQDIASAPKNGVTIVAYNGLVGEMHWIEGEHAGDRWGLWAWVDEIHNDTDPSPTQPTAYLVVPEIPDIFKAPFLASNPEPA